MKKILTIFIIGLICFGISGCGKKNDNVINLNYDDVCSISEGLILVQKDGKYGFIDGNKQEVVPCVYDSAHDFENGVAEVRKDGKAGYIDKKGNIIIPCAYDIIYAYNDSNESFAIVQVGNKYGCIDMKTGNEIMKCKYDLIYYALEGRFIFEKAGKLGLFDMNTNVELKFNYSLELDWYFRNFSEGMMAVTYNNKWGYINTKGEEIIPCIYDYARDFSDGLACVCMGDKYGYIDKTGKEIIPFIYNGARSFEEGISVVENSYGKWGVIDKSGKTVVPFVYSDMLGANRDTASNEPDKVFFEGIATMYKSEDYNGIYVNNKAQEITSLYYDNTYYFIEDMGLVSKNDKYGFVNKKGEEIIPCMYDDIYDDGEPYYSLYENLVEMVKKFKVEGLLKVSKAGKYGFVNEKGEEIIQCMYDIADNFSKGLAMVKENNKYGVIDKQGNKVIPCIYDKLHCSEGIVVAKDEDGWKIIKQE